METPEELTRPRTVRREGGVSLTIHSGLLLRLLFGWRRPTPSYVTASHRLWLFWLMRRDKRRHGV